MATQILNRRLVRDAGLKVTKALPAAGASNNTGTIDLGSGPWHAEEIEIEISIPACSAHTDSTKNITITAQHSTDDSSYSNLDNGTGANNDVILTTPGVAATGSAARVATVRLPPGTNRYIQFTQAVTSAGPTLTAISVTYTPLM